VQGHHAPTRDAFDARNCAQRPSSFCDLAAEQVNSPEFNPATNICPDLHSDFAQSIQLPFDTAPAPVTTMKTKEKFGEVRSHLVRASCFVSALSAATALFLITLHMTS
jgi:hypothetical protein